MKLLITACLAVILFGCASMGPDYAVSKATEQEVVLLESQTKNNVYGHWISDDALRITLGLPIEYSAMLPVSSLKAEVSGDLITLHLAIETDKSVDTSSGVAPLCEDLMKVTYVLHKLRHQNYRVLVAPVYYGNPVTWDAMPLEIK